MALSIDEIMERAWESMERFFDELPYFQPRVWKLVAASGTTGFLAGLGIGLWAYFSLA